MSPAWPTPGRVPRFLVAKALTGALACLALWAAPALAASPPEITKSFGAQTVPLNGTTTLSFLIGNPNPSIGLTGVGFTDSLPSGLVVADSPDVSNDCGGTVTADPLASSVGLSGGSLSAGVACLLSVSVKGTTAGQKNNSVQVTSNSGSGNTSNASITVAAPPVLSMHFGAGWFVPGGSTSLTFEIDNPNAVPLTGVGFSDALPGGLTVANPNGLSGSCGGGTIDAGPGGSLISLTGGTLAADGHCSFSVNVAGSGAGERFNATGHITSNEGGTGNQAGAQVALIAPGDRVFWTSYLNAAIISAGDLMPGGGAGFITPASVNHTALGIALDPAAGRMYWADLAASKIEYTNLDGSGTSELDTTGAMVNLPWGVALDPGAGRIYWTNNNANAISYASLSGGAGGDLNTTGATVAFPQGVAIDPAAGRIYWANSLGGPGNTGVISYANLSGSGGGHDLITGAATVNDPMGLALDPAAGRIYWTNQDANKISYARVDGGGGGDLTVTGAAVDQPWGIAIDHARGRIYWINHHAQTLSVANLDGSGGQNVDTTGGLSPSGFLALLWTPSGTGAPVITGGSARGSALSCSRGSWAADELGSFLYQAPQSFAYQWSLNGTDISGATGSTYTAPSTGDYRCRVTATNEAGSGSQTSSAHSVVPVPRISALRETNSIFAVGARSTPLSGATAARHKRGTVFSFRLDQAATVKIVIRRLAPGRRVGRRCVANRPSLRRKRPCTRAIKVATLTRSAHAGLNKVPFSGRIRRRALKPGRYRAIFTASDAAGTSAAKALRFRIVRR